MPNLAALRAAIFLLSAKNRWGGGHICAPPPPAVRGLTLHMSMALHGKNRLLLWSVLACKNTTWPSPNVIRPLQNIMLNPPLRPPYRYVSPRLQAIQYVNSPSWNARRNSFLRFSAGSQVVFLKNYKCYLQYSWISQFAAHVNVTLILRQFILTLCWRRWNRCFTTQRTSTLERGFHFLRIAKTGKKNA